MTRKFDVHKDELVDILIKRANHLRTINWYLPTETQNALDNFQEVLDEYRDRVKKYQEEHPYSK